MNDEILLQKLASKLDQDELVALDQLLQKVAYTSAQQGANASDVQEEELQKMAAALVESGASDEEIVIAVEKLAEERQVTGECDNIVQDCATMGTYIGKYAGDVALNVFFNGLQDYVKQAGEMPEEFKKKKKGKEDEESEEEESEEEKEASARIKVLKEILAGTAFQNAG